MKSKILRALLSAFLAIGIWFYVVTVISPDSDKQFYNIPVDDSSKVLLHEQQLMIVDMQTNEVSVHLEGNRVDLNKLSSDNIPVTLDVSKIYEPGPHDVPYDVDLPDGVTIRDKKPSTIRVEVVERGSKPVPVDVEYNDTKVANGFIPDKDNKILDFSEVEIAGPVSVLSQITKARIDVDLTDLKETINAKYPIVLCNDADEPVDAKHVTVNTESVNLILEIMRLKEVKLRVDILTGGGATEQNITYSIEPQSIWLSGSEELLNPMEELTIGQIDLSEIREDQQIKLPIKLKEGLYSEDGITEATVNIKLPELATKIVTVKNIIAENVPEGMNVELLRKVLEIELRGPKEKLEKIDPESLKILVDFKDTEIGAVKKKAVVDGLDAEVGTLGSYTVSANVTKTGA